MKENYWKGINSTNILILGESHHDENNDAGKIPDYTTASVIDNHIKGIRRHTFFYKIARSFGFGDKEPEFYNRIFFMNYMDVLCDVRGGAVYQFLDDGIKRTQLNDSLFQFINIQGISTVVCFSKTVYNVLPGIYDEKCENVTLGKINIGKKNEKRFIVEICEYKKGINYKYCNIVLDHDLIVYGCPHPVANYGYEDTKLLYEYFCKDKRVSVDIKELINL